MEPLFAILGVILALLAGLAVGWMLAHRSHAPLRDEVGGLRERCARNEADLATHQERSAATAGLRAMLDEVTRERDAAQGACGSLREELAGIKAQLSGQAEQLKAVDAITADLRLAHDEREALGRKLTEAEARADEQAKANARLVDELKGMREQLTGQFKELARGALDEAQAKFLARADDRFKESEAKTRAKIEAVVQPVAETLKRYEEQVGKAEAERRDAFGTLAGQIEAMRSGTERVSSEAARLVNALRHAPKARGNWGEQQLRNVLETCGLAEHTDFRTEVSVEGEEGGRLRPDAVVRVPGGKALIIDAKVSLNAYQDSINATDDGERARAMDAHVASMRAHVTALGGKAYWAQFDEAPEYVIMFVPGEHFVTAAMEHDPKLWDDALARRVIVATPANLVAILRTVSAVWRQEKLAREAAQIAALGKELHNRLATMAGHVVKLGRNLELATGAYNQFVGSLESQVLTQARRFEALEVADSGKKVDSPNVLESSPRPLTKLTPPEAIAAE